MVQINNELKILSINSVNFRKYGRIIDYPLREKKGDKRNLWRIVHTSEAKTGWRVAYLVLRDRTIGRMECHPDSDETFEPVKGKALFFVSREQDFKKIECFSLDKPVILFKGIWHGLIREDDEVDIKITENAKVKCEYWQFGFRIDKQGLKG
ncbi:MAG: hypothetical protein HQL26_03730 [Candidatus Omnitrophica bacterium]|nr:hypothetical protein [Candidatus Omnitrophota bacterium]